MKEEYMRRAIEIAKLGTGKVNPNPLVGAVIVKDDKIIAEGYHRYYGDLHAERHAFSNLADPKLAEGAEMYVTLEPCCHYGKQPPCTLAIIEHGIKKVYVGSNDPNPLVAGKGIKQLRDAGIDVETEFLIDECDALNDVFFHFITKQTPYVVMKYAMTMDGRIATDNGSSKWITGEAAREHVQELRNELSAIMVGVQTVIMDNPRLTCRLEDGRNPIRVICDSHLRIPMESYVVESAREVPTYIATLDWQSAKAEELIAKGVKLIVCKEVDGHVDLQDLMVKLGELKIDGLLLEGGAKLNASALKQGIVDRVMVYMAPKIFGGKGTYVPVGGVGVDDAMKGYPFILENVRAIGNDVLLTYKKEM